MARTTAPADPMQQDYAEDTTGTLRSGGAPGAFNVDPNDPDNVIGRSGGNVVNYRRVGADAPPGQVARGPLSAVPAARPAAGLYPPGSAAQMQFNAKGATPAVPGVAPVAVAPVAPATPGAAAAAPKGSPLDVLSGVPPANFDVNLQSSPSPYDLSAPRPPVPPTGAEQAGAGVRTAVGNVVDPAIAGLAKGELAAADATTGFLNRWGVQPVAAAGRAFGGFARGVLGKSTPAGVSNASAAGFTTPTKAQPNPVTPTTPTANVDRSESSLGRFGVSDAEFNRRRLSFSGI